jgi:DNA-directed RNA polymerase subunit F
MPWKTDENEALVLEDGNPVWVWPDKKETAYNPETTQKKVNELNSENSQLRLDAKKAKEQLEVFEGIDPEKARKAIETVSNLDAKKLVDAGDVEKLKAQLAEDANTKLSEKDKTIQELQGTLNAEMIGGRFSRSSYVKKRLCIPADMAERYFGDHFKIEGDRVVAYHQNGNLITSREKIGDPADFDEALEALVDAYPHKEQILVSDDTPGVGSPPGATGHIPPGSITPEQIGSMSMDEYRKARNEGKIK